MSRRVPPASVPSSSGAPALGRVALGVKPRTGRESPIFAALDLGTNNCRLLIARPTPDFVKGGPAQACSGGQAGFVVVDAFSRIIRLGEGLDRRGALSETAMGRAIEALKVCAGKIRRRHVMVARQVATEACRRAANCGEFLARVRSETGLEIEIITPREEAVLALAGCAPLLDATAPEALVFDIGGGSTELMWARLSPQHPALPNSGGMNGHAVTDAEAEEPTLLDSMSLPFGVMNLAERADGDCLTPEAFERVVGRIREHTEAFEAQNRIRERIAAGTVQMLGSSGTVTTLAGIRMGLSCYDRARVDGCHLDFAEIRGVISRLLSLDCKARALEPCIGPSRADLVVAGCAILEAICRTWPVGRLRVADRGVREGILLNLMRAHRVAPPRQAAIRPATIQ